MARKAQQLLFENEPDVRPVPDATSSTFVSNMSLPVHRWFRYSAGFSAAWVEQVVKEKLQNGPLRVFDPFGGSATTLIAAEGLGVECLGLESHPFVARIANAKLQWRTDPEAYRQKAKELRAAARKTKPDVEGFAPLIYSCYDEAALADLDCLRQALSKVDDGSPAFQLAWLTVAAILRKTSKAGTAQWQYVLPKKTKRAPLDVFAAFDETVRTFHRDMLLGQDVSGPRAVIKQADARDLDAAPADWADLVVTSPPYPNNYDYADATRLEMSFFREISGWGDLQGKVRTHLVRSCSQHVPERAVDLERVLSSDELQPIAEEIRKICVELGEVRKTKGGKKTYHLMVACYFYDLAQVWGMLRRACAPGSQACFVIGDSAPYGVYVPVIPWLGSLALAAGFKSWRFERTRDRNVKWKNRKHRVPLQEGRLWVEG